MYKDIIIIGSKILIHIINSFANIYIYTYINKQYFGNQQLIQYTF